MNFLVVLFVLNLSDCKGFPPDLSPRLILSLKGKLNKSGFRFVSTSSILFISYECVCNKMPETTKILTTKKIL